MTEDNKFKDIENFLGGVGEKISDKDLKAVIKIVKTGSGIIKNYNVNLERNLAGNPDDPATLWIAKFSAAASTGGFLLEKGLSSPAKIVEAFAEFVKKENLANDIAQFELSDLQTNSESQGFILVKKFSESVDFKKESNDGVFDLLMTLKDYYNGKDPQTGSYILDRKKKFFFDRRK
jgi:hypothetical protein